MIARAGVATAHIPWQARPVPPRHRIRRHVPISRAVVLQVLTAVAPAMLLLRMERLEPAAFCLFGLITVFVTRSVLRRREMAALAIIVGTLPAQMLLRDHFVFHSVTALLMASVAVLLHRSTIYAAALRRSGWFVLLFVATIYWLTSFMVTGEHYRNLRALEMAFAAAAVVLLATHRHMLASAMIGFTGTLVLWGLAMFSEGTRLGSGAISETWLGNPMTYGAGLALSFLLLTAERGRSLGLERSPWLRIGALVGVSVFLLLTTARGSWLCAFAGLAVIMRYDRIGRRTTIAALVAVVLGGIVALATPRAGTLRVAAERTFSGERTVLNRTSGRSDQWRLLPTVVGAAPILGHGPGTGGQVYARASFENVDIQFRPGIAMQWHSLYLQTAVETGLTGVFVLGLLLFRLLRRNLREVRTGRTVVPLLGTVGFMTVALSVLALDAHAGLFLGFGLLRAYPLNGPGAP